MFEWNEEKKLKNIEKHGVNFEDAKHVFSSETVTFDDNRFDYGEDRYITLGLLDNRIMVVTHTQRNSKTRIISMRKANKREQKIYKKRLEKT